MPAQRVHDDNYDPVTRIARDIVRVDVRRRIIAAACNVERILFRSRDAIISTRRMRILVDTERP